MRERKKQGFDPDYGPHNPVNRQAAEDHDLRYDRKRKVYRDQDGALVRDRYGQPY